MEIDDYYINLITKSAKEIRERMEDSTIYGIPMNEFTLKHTDIALVCAYYLGTLDSTINWKKKEKKDLI